ncbi:thioredoxin-like 1-2, chloroplastic [Nymphaea colorata]|nr:thioredoxin-like 1-2, chloroplastic [Nymphaea colorata]
MAKALKSNLCVPCATFSLSTSLSKQSPGLGFSRSPSSLRFQHSMASSSSSSIRTEFYGKPGGISETQSTPRAFDNPQAFPVQAQSSPLLGKALKWWEKGLQPNMREIDSAEDLVNSLRDAGNQLVIVDFFSPGCGGCRALHPKVCQLAEMNPDVLFLQINYEKHKSMCYSLNVHVLPFFRFYRGAQGRVCSFSCTNATIKKFKDALAKHTTDRSSLGPAKGLEQSELLALAANKELSFSYSTEPNTSSSPVAPARPEETHRRAPSVKPAQGADGRELVTATGR